MLEQFKQSAFEGCLNTSFHLEHPAYGSIDLRLVEVRAGIPSPVTESFSLYFIGPSQKPLPQQIYELNHARLGKLPIFVVPIGRNASGLVYEAVFNALR